ncbi:MAG: hypothetical protein ACOYL6_00675 [Bacteriovoracaceae bacterium]
MKVNSVLKFNQALFGTFLFSLKSTLFIIVTFSLILATLFLLKGGKRDDYGLIFVMLLYIAPVFFLSSILVFAGSVVTNKILPYPWCILSAVLANLLSSLILGSFFSPLNYIIYFTTIAAIYYSVQCFNKTWETLGSMISSELINSK